MPSLPRLTPKVSAQLDSIRGLSAIIVLLAHANQVLIAHTFSGGVHIMGYLAQFSVMVFFVLSGFLIGCSILNNLALSGEFDTGRYFKDRVVRIYPPLIVSLVMMWILCELTPYAFESGSWRYLKIPNITLPQQAFATNIEQILGALTFANGFRTSTPYPNAPLWSLSFEIWYYVLAALAFSFKRHKTVCALIVIFVVMLTWNNSRFYILMPVWGVGLLLSLAYARGRQKYTKLAASLMLALAAATGISIFFSFQGASSNEQWLVDMNQFRIISGMAFACYLWLIITEQATFPTLLHRSGGFSYTLYIIHFPVLLFIYGCFQTKVSHSLSWALMLSVAGILSSLTLAYFVSLFAENRPLIKKVMTPPSDPGRVRVDGLPTSELACCSEQHATKTSSNWNSIDRPPGESRE